MLTIKVHQGGHAVQRDGGRFAGQWLGAPCCTLRGGEEAGPERHGLGRQEHVGVLQEGQHLQTQIQPLKKKG